MTLLIEQTSAALLAPAELDLPQLSSVLGQMTGKQIDRGELFFQQSWSEYWSLEDGRVKDANFDIKRGVGATVFSGEKCGFAYADDIDLDSLHRAARAAKSISQTGGASSSVVVQPVADVTSYYQATNPLQAIDDQHKVALLQRIHYLAHQADPRIIKVNASLSGSYDLVQVIDTNGHYAADIRPMVRVNVSVIAEEKGRKESGYAGGGGRYSYQQLLTNGLVEQFSAEAVRVALINLTAEPTPAGVMPVVMGAGWSGVLLHEAVGHGLEGDFNRRGVSAFSGKLGQKVASELCTVVDDGTLPERRGSLSIDDEGVASQHTVLIENGVLKNYLQDKHNAQLMGMVPTGNGRRESYAHPTLPRMTNTYMLAGSSDKNDIIASVDKGLYIVGLAGGSVDITSGKFVFSTSEAYLIEQGKIKHPVKGATLVGMGAEVMQRVSMVGNDLALDSGVGICGKDGQSVPVGVGQPTIKVDAMTVGGTSV